VQKKKQQNKKRKEKPNENEFTDKLEQDRDGGR
jgi:hypothetical protein